VAGAHGNHHGLKGLLTLRIERRRRNYQNRSDQQPVHMARSHEQSYCVECPLIDEDKWRALDNRILDLLTGQPLTISAEGKS
jgi:hypothetical protein